MLQGFNDLTNEAYVFFTHPL